MKTIEKIKEDISYTLDTYKKGLESYSNVEFTIKPNAESWSLAQLYDHLSVSSQKFFLANVNRCIEQRGGQEGGDKTTNGEAMMKNGSFPDIKIKVPDVFKAIEIIPKSIEEYKSVLESIQNSVDSIFNVSTDINENYKTSHPVFGYLNAYEWYENLEMHLRHHLKQKVGLEEFLKNKI